MELRIDRSGILARDCMVTIHRGPARRARRRAAGTVRRWDRLGAHRALGASPPHGPYGGRSHRNLPLAGTFSVNLEGNPSFRSYETADADTAHSTLTVRDD